jgi:hypothetical protein
LDQIAATVADKDLVVFDCALDPYFSRHRKYAERLENAIYLVSPFKIVGANAIKVAFLLCKGAMVNLLDSIIYSIGEDINYAVRVAIRAFQTHRYDVARERARSILIAKAATFRIAVDDCNCVTDASSPHVFASVTVPDISMTRFMNMDVHRRVYLETGILFIPSAFYSMSDSGPLQFRVNLGKTELDHSSVFPRFVKRMRELCRE